MLSRTWAALESKNNILEIKNELCNLKPFVHIIPAVEAGNLSRDLSANVFISEHFKSRRNSLVALR